MGIFPISLSFLWRCHARVSHTLYNEAKRHLFKRNICMVRPEFTECLNSFSWNSNDLEHFQTPLHYPNNKDKETKTTKIESQPGNRDSALT